MLPGDRWSLWLGLGLQSEISEAAGVGEAPDMIYIYIYINTWYPLRVYFHFNFSIAHLKTTLERLVVLLMVFFPLLNALESFSNTFQTFFERVFHFWTSELSADSKKTLRCVCFNTMSQSWCFWCWYLHSQEVPGICLHSRLISINMIYYTYNVHAIWYV